MIRFAFVLLIILAGAGLLSGQTLPSAPSDTMYVIPAGPQAGTFSNQARVTVTDTIAGWAKIQVEGWVPVGVALPLMKKAEMGQAAEEKVGSATKAKEDEKPRQCAAITKKGKRCTRTAKPGSIYCWQHDK